MPTKIKLEKGIKVKPETDVNESPFYKLVQEYLESIDAKEDEVTREATPWVRMYGLTVGEADYGVSFLIAIEKSDTDAPGGKEDTLLTLETAIGRIDEATNVEELQKRISYLNSNTKQLPLSYAINPSKQVIVRFSTCECGGTETARLVIHNIVSNSLGAFRWLKKDCNLTPFIAEKRTENFEEKVAS